MHRDNDGTRLDCSTIVCHLALPKQAAKPFGCAADASGCIATAQNGVYLAAQLIGKAILQIIDHSVHGDSGQILIQTGLFRYKLYEFFHCCKSFPIWVSKLVQVGVNTTTEIRMLLPLS